jgi:hypothetical protein
VNKLIADIEQWGLDKGILPNPNKIAQYFKTCEEVAELNDATLIMQTHAWDVTLEECVQQAYDVISKRSGKMVNGQFVKD